MYSTFIQDRLVNYNSLTVQGNLISYNSLNGTGESPYMCILETRLPTNNPVCVHAWDNDVSIGHIVYCSE